jgi:hypothetical protein
MIRKKINNLFKKENFFYFVSLPILLVIRYQWTMVSQFREDQSTKLWLAYKYDIFDTPVGLLSSKMIPQPNGVIVFGKILTIFDSALSSTLFYSLLQVILFYFLVKEITDRPELQKFFFSLLSLSMLMGSSSVEFWNQWTLVQINTLFFIFFFKYLNSPSSNLLLVNICIAIIPPTIYLAGIANTIVFFAMILSAFYFVGKNKSEPPTKYFILSSITWLVTIFSIVWIPYLRSLGIERLLSVSNLSNFERIRSSAGSFIRLPVVYFRFWTDNNSFKILQIDDRVNSNLLLRTYEIFITYHKLILLLFMMLLIYTFVTFIKTEKLMTDKKISIKWLYLNFFIISSVILSPFLGGPNFSKFQRMDTFVQYYPFFLIIWFLLPFLTIENKSRLVFFQNFFKTIGAIFIGINVFLTFLVVDEALNYNGNILTESDVPLKNKIEVTNFIASQVDINSDNEVSISYFLNGIWGWIPEHSEVFSEWYPEYPFTIGRFFDYQLLNNHSIINSLEGKNFRDYSDSQFIVSYSFDEVNFLDNTLYEHFYIDRLRVSIRTEDK